MSAVDESAVPPAHKAQSRVHRGDGQLGRSSRRRRRGRPRPHGRRERDLRAVLPLRHARLPLDRPQGDLRRQQLADAATASAGSTPSRCCGRWPTRCSTHEGDNPAKRDDAADRPYRRNLELAKKIRADWQDGKLDKSATTELLADAAHGLERRRLRRRSSSCSTAASAPQSILGRAARRRRRAADAAARHRRAARGDDDQRPALRLPGQRRRRNAAAAAAAERGVPAAVPRRDERPRRRQATSRSTS